MTNYGGWIPNVAGRLSFSLIGADCNWPSKCTVVNAGRNSRRILCAQRRELSDALIPNAYLRFLYECETDFIFLVDASAHPDAQGDNNILRGRVYVFTVEGWNSVLPSNNSRRAASPRNAVEAALYAYKVGGEERFSSFCRAADAIAASGYLSEGSLYFSTFELNRSGLIELSDLTVAENLRFSASLLDQSADLEPSQHTFLYNQIFYFLKDITHAHKHHPKNHDTIISATALDQEHSWAREIQFGMHRAVLGHRRTGKVERLNNAVGVMAYMASFERFLSSHFPNHETAPSGIRIALGYGLEETQRSVTAEIENAKEEDQRRLARNIAIFGLPVAIVSFFRSENATNAISTFWDKILDPMFAPPLVSLTLIFGLFLLISSRYGTIRIAELPTLRNPYRVYRAMSKPQGQAYLLLLALVPAGVWLFLYTEFNIHPLRSPLEALLFFWAEIFAYLFIVWFWVPFYFTAGQLIRRLLSIAFPIDQLCHYFVRLRGSMVS